MHHTTGRIVVKALIAAQVLDRAIDAVLTGDSGLAYHLAPDADPVESGREPQAQFYSITYVPSGCAPNPVLPIRGEKLAREAIEQIAALAEQCPDCIWWNEKRPFSSVETVLLVEQAVYRIVVGA